jgi:hypothetical protein
MRNIFLASIVAILSSSCATLFSGTEESIRVDSEPSDATIYVDGRNMGTTPASFIVEKVTWDDEPVIKIEKEGYTTEEFELSNKFDRVSLFNSTGIYAWSTDFGTGALYKYSPTDYRVILKEEKKSSLNLYENDGLMAQYIFSNFEKISEDISQKDGQYLQALNSLIGLSESYKNDFAMYLHDLQIDELNFPSDMIEKIKEYKKENPKYFAMSLN